MLKFAVRWKTVRSAASSAISGMAWMPDEPVPMTATRRPVKSTPSCGQCAVCRVRPANRSMPGISGSFEVDRQPVAITSCSVSHRSPDSVVTVQRPSASRKCADATRVSSRTPSRSSKRSATWWT